ncbi:hypothetical protein [Mycoavidus cysteinexigens]|uniref:hypothetical protein n=1 Tax=Mycoavidus cysteinexigens TaxID=1553431 RepID=UPI000F84A30B|nr:hypothetical protein [Mycoavidus cysteinexigens]
MKPGFIRHSIVRPSGLGVDQHNHPHGSDVGAAKSMRVHGDVPLRSADKEPHTSPSAPSYDPLSH